jgi:hypothetical protein
MSNQGWVEEAWAALLALEVETDTCGCLAWIVWVGAHPSLSLSNGALTGTPMSQKTTKIIPTLADRFLRSRLQRVKRWGLVLGDGISGHTRFLHDDHGNCCENSGGKGDAENS